MGRRRGQRNAARDKQWPGATSAAERAFKRNGKWPEFSLEQQANMLLYGYPNVLEQAEQQEVFTILGGGAPKRTLEFYKTPTSTHFYQKKEKPKCIQCGRDRSAFGASLCRACYRGNAHNSFLERSDGLEFFLERQTNLAWDSPVTSTGGPIQSKDGTGGKHRFVLTSYEEDFSIALLEQIEQEELAQGKPFVHCKPPEARERKPLFYSLPQAAMKMTPNRERPKLIKQGRKMRGWLRGGHLGKKAA